MSKKFTKFTILQNLKYYFRMNQGQFEDPVSNIWHDVTSNKSLWLLNLVSLKFEFGHNSKVSTVTTYFGKTKLITLHALHENPITYLPSTNEVQGKIMFSPLCDSVRKEEEGQGMSCSGLVEGPVSAGPVSAGPVLEG